MCSIIKTSVYYNNINISSYVTIIKLATTYRLKEFSYVGNLNISLIRNKTYVTLSVSKYGIKINVNIRNI
ncbi:hypothetical protein Paride_0414 [Pseudomonas phage Paride]|nr:hypothetical protein Paride_0414 [Pseudomonas phage Paride]